MNKGAEKYEPGTGSWQESIELRDHSHDSERSDEHSESGCGGGYGRRLSKCCILGSVLP